MPFSIRASEIAKHAAVVDPWRGPQRGQHRRREALPVERRGGTILPVVHGLRRAMRRNLIGAPSPRCRCATRQTTANTSGRA